MTLSMSFDPRVDSRMGILGQRGKDLQGGALLIVETTRVAMDSVASRGSDSD